MEGFKIKEGLGGAWEREAGQNARDPYSFGVIIAVTKSFEVLDKGGTPKEADEAWKGLDMTGFMAGCAAGLIGKYHERGDEFRKYWNERFGVSEEQAKGGTVNPAILTMGKSRKLSSSHGKASRRGRGPVS